MSEPLPSPSPAIVETVARYYAERLGRFGATPQGVDWSSAESQALRFTKLLAVVEGEERLSLLDYGCGYGALADFLEARAPAIAYRGFDISPEMIERARHRHQHHAWCTFTADAAALEPVDYVVASGIFNVKLTHTVDAWSAYVLETLDRMRALAGRGFAFNMLSTYSDPPKRRDDLYYADPREMFDRCKRRFSPRVALLHDYPLYEFTIVVRT